MREGSIFEDLNAAWLKSVYLAGVDLTFDDGSAYPGFMWDRNIAASAAWLEHELGLTFDPRDIEDELHDIADSDRERFYPVRLDHRPLLGLAAARLRYGNNPTAQIPLSWARIVNEMFAQIHLIPTSESLGALTAQAGLPFFLSTLTAAEWYPGFFEFDYRAGFPRYDGTVILPKNATTLDVPFPSRLFTSDYRVELAYVSATPTGGALSARRYRDKFILQAATAPTKTGGEEVAFVVRTLPADIEHVIGLRASMQPLDVAGDLIAGAGIASISQSQDGVSQSINTTSSATNSGYGARVLQYMKELKEFLPAVIAKYRMPRIFAL